MKTKLLKNIFLSSAALFLFTACSKSNINSANSETPNKNITQNNLNWTGYYKGVLPCASCSGIETSLELKENDNKITYELKEKYLEEKDASYITKGIALREENSSLLILQSKSEKSRKVFIGQNYISFDSMNLNDDYILRKTTKIK